MRRASAIALFILATLLALGVIGDANFYQKIHKDLLLCADFIENKINSSATLPTDDEMREWAQDRNISSLITLGYKPNHIKDNNNKYIVSYWDGDAYESYFPSTRSFTTQVPQHLALPTTFIILFLGAGVLLIRHHKVEQGAAANP